MTKSNQLTAAMLFVTSTLEANFLLFSQGFIAKNKKLTKFTTNNNFLTEYNSYYR